jgi:pimeloyl-ACP methyl ester carboxylesterase
MPLLANIYYAQFKGSTFHRPPVILIHGAGSNHLVWPAEIRRLRNTLVLAIDLPGHGKSGGFAFHEVKQYTTSILDLMEGLGHNRAILVGHSLGAAIALQFAYDNPANVEGLVCIAGAASFSLAPTFIDLFRLPQGNTTAHDLLNTYFQPLHGNHEWYPKLIRNMATVRKSLWYTDFRASANFDLHKQVPEIKTPTIVMAGTGDPMVSFSSSSFLAQQLPNAKLIRYSQHGHLLMLENPKKVARDILEFYKQVNGDGE